MKFEQQFIVSHPREKVWNILGNLDVVASCFPGVQITHPLDDGKFGGRITIALGPMRLDFKGVGELLREKSRWFGEVRGSGSDMGTKSKAEAKLSYNLFDDATSGTRIEIKVDYKLYGMLAQVGRPALIEQVAKQLTSDFKVNLNRFLKLFKWILSQ